MGKLLDCIRSREADFIAQQKVFFVATAPLSQDHHVNVSPKAPGQSVAVLDPHTVAYLDLTGSGAETAAHVAENQRMTILFCNIEKGAPKILRLHGKAQVIVRGNVPESIAQKFPTQLISSPGYRAIYILKVDRISTSCGYSLPIMTFGRYRETLNEWTKHRGTQGILEYGIEKNSFSIDGIPSVGIFRHNNNNNQEDGFHIVPKPTNGYIYGEKVPGSPKLLQKAINRMRISKLDHYGMAIFLIGFFVGNFFHWIPFLSSEARDKGL
ncbi:hypothetical protein ACHAWF_007834 [Thalassiosira exigua]